MNALIAAVCAAAGALFDVRRNVELARLVGDSHWFGALWRAVFGLPFCIVGYVLAQWFYPATFAISGAGVIWLLAAAAAQFCSQTFVLSLARQEGFAPLAVRSSASISIAVVFGFGLLGDGSLLAALVAVASIIGSASLFDEAWSDGVRLRGWMASDAVPLWLRKPVVRLLPGASLAVQAVCFRAAGAQFFSHSGLSAGMGVATMAMAVQALALAPTLRIFDAVGFAAIKTYRLVELARVGLISALSAGLIFSAYSLAQASFVRLVASCAAFFVSNSADRDLRRAPYSMRALIEMTIVLVLAFVSTLIALAA